ncbi:MAG: hypothetical protein CVU56_00480 [Deltaproteobacteria bacterium HGW-Deltaproteobacteria-14]|jgi:hypothetical protein|nr:MAG: hypothetical protein CVU56_00480 [Deltaproteobacteria bacterium HGW-Deltaproteobacteria-14]
MATYDRADAKTTDGQPSATPQPGGSPAGVRGALRGLSYGEQVQLLAVGDGGPGGGEVAGAGGAATRGDGDGGTMAGVAALVTSGQLGGGLPPMSKRTERKAHRREERAARRGEQVAVPVPERATLGPQPAAEVKVAVPQGRSADRTADELALEMIIYDPAPSLTREQVAEGEGLIAKLPEGEMATWQKRLQNRVARDKAREEQQLRAQLAVWQLAPEALEGAVALLKEVPSVRICSGRRTRSVEAAAWAPWIAKNQFWMKEMLLGYAGSAELQEVQRWVNENWAKVSGDAAAISTKLRATFEALSDAELGKLSQHPAGYAIDINLDPALNATVLGALPNIAQVVKEPDHWHLGFKIADAGAKQPGSGL